MVAKNKLHKTLTFVFNTTFPLILFCLKGFITDEIFSCEVLGEVEKLAMNVSPIPASWASGLKFSVA